MKLPAKFKWVLVSVMFTGLTIFAGIKIHAWLNPPPMYEGQPVPQWVRELGDANYQVAHRAQTTVPGIGTPATPYLIDLLENPESKLDTMRNSMARKFPWLKLKPYDFARARSTAIQLLGQMAPGDTNAVPALVKALDDKDETLAVAARESLSQAGEAAVLPLAKALKHESASVRFLAVSALADLGPNTSAAVPALLETLHDEVPQLRSAAIVALGRSGAEVSTLLPAFVKATNDKVVTVKLDAINAIAAFQSEAAPAVPALIKLLKDEEQWVRSSAAFALGQIGSAVNETTSALHEALNDSSAHVRVTTGNALWKITGKSDGLVPVFLEALKESDLRLRNYATQGLLQLGPPAYPHVPLIFSVLKDEFEPGRYHSALRLLGDADETLLPYLQPCLKDSDARIRGGAVFVLERLAARLPAALELLKEATKDIDASVREAAERALRNLKNNGG
ncbi:MAG TPA: HEAT repeat domain-containing protein [Verrucomicrobiae bacterium]